jgi:hypothetical protein
LHSAAVPTIREAACAGAMRIDHAPITGPTKETVMNRSTVAVVGALFVSQGLSAAPTCTTATTANSSYVATCQGQLSPAPGVPMQPASLIATCTSSATNVFNCIGFVNVGGSVLQQQLSGQANQFDNCFGTIAYKQTLNGGPAPDLHITYIVTENGNTIYGLPYDQGQVLSCTLRRTATP